MIRSLLTFSLAAVKSAFVTRIRRSRRANKPASVQTALISAPDRSSFAVTNSSRSTSSARFILDVCSLSNQRSNQLMISLVSVLNRVLEDMPLRLDVR